MYVGIVDCGGQNFFCLSMRFLSSILDAEAKEEEENAGRRFTIFTSDASCIKMYVCAPILEF